MLKTQISVIFVGFVLSNGALGIQVSDKSAKDHV